MATTFQFKPFSRRQKKILTWWREGSGFEYYDGIICDGAIRSGKTLPMAFSFVVWAMQTFNGEALALCGKTVGAFRRNVLRYMIRTLPPKGYIIKERRGDNSLIISKNDVTNTFYIFGGRDERAQDTVQGATLAGALFDEVALMPESFVNQVVGRCSVSGSKLWFNCNPEYPAHWFRTEWILKHAEKRLLYLHFTMEDNLSLSEDVRERYKRLYTGVFYKRFILGLWTAAAGVIYQEFADDKDQYIADAIPPIWYGTIGVDFGGNGSAHAFVLTGFTRGYKDVIVLKEYYHDNKKDGKLNPQELTDAFVQFVRECRKICPIYEAFCDSAEQTLIEGFRYAIIRAGIPIDVKNALKGAINERIALYNSLIAQKRFSVYKGCHAVISALEQAVYKDGLTDERLDNGTTNIDSLDAMEYSTESVASAIMGRN